MEKRQSINVPGASHVNPIPSACRRGPFVVTGAISGTDPATGKMPDDLDAQNSNCARCWSARTRC